MSNYEEPTKVTEDVIKSLNENKYLRVQNEIFLKLSQDELSFNEYFEQLETLEREHKLPIEKISWEQLKIDNNRIYYHSSPHRCLHKW